MDDVVLSMQYRRGRQPLEQVAHVTRTKGFDQRLHHARTGGGALEGSSGGAGLRVRRTWRHQIKQSTLAPVLDGGSVSA
jgi:hypothetical protein